MDKSLLIFALVFGMGLVTQPVGAEGIRRNHKPWFGSKADADEKRQKRVTKAPASAMPTKPIPQVRRYRSRDRLKETAPTVIENARSIDSDKTENVSPKGIEIAEKASSYKGTRYRFGGTTKRGLDCSGLVSRVWDDLQMKKIPRVSAALYEKGTPVKLSDLQPGDLVFFKNTYKRGISHVGVYAGKNRFIHASPSRGVSTAKLSEPYYQLRYAGARRLY